MSTEAAKKKAERREAQKAKRMSKKSASAASLASSASKLSLADTDPNSDAALLSDSARQTTGVLTSRPTSRDIKIESFSLALAGNELIQDCAIELTIGRRYGLIGQNGCGKTSFLQCLANREVPIPEHIDIYHLHTEAAPTDRTALETVVDTVKKELESLQAQEEQIMEEVGPEDERLEAIYERMEELDPATFEVRAAELLHGLGFTKPMMARATKDMSGGWRMRVALAQALFAAPTLLLLDEPTNHLDLEGCVWLEHYLKDYKKCLLLVSHSQDFLNGVCTHTIWITQKKLTYYTGNYDTFVKTRAENEAVQAKKHAKEQEDIKHIKAFIASCGTYANLVKQAKSKQKILDKMEADGLTPPVVRERSFAFSFPECDKLPPPVMPFVDVSFSYSGDLVNNAIYRNLELGVDCDSRIALVGPNGAGKSTLLKLMTGELSPTNGTVSRHPHLSMGRYHQHSVDQLNMDQTVLEFFQTMFPPSAGYKKSDEEWRAFIGRFGLTGKQQTTKIGALSEGQRCRIIYGIICMGRPNMLLLDEPTNHLDIEAIDALAAAINGFNGGLVLVSHDFRLIDQVAKEIWICEGGKVTPWKNGIREYKKSLAKKMGLA